jgi:ankyrin repeat protein
VEADSRDNAGWMPLSNAAFRASEAMVKLLLEQDNTKTNSRDDEGRMSLSCAAAYTD